MFIIHFKILNSVASRDFLILDKCIYNKTSIDKKALVLKYIL